MNAPVEQPLSCPLQKVYLNRLSIFTPSMVLCLAPLLKWILCSLWFTEKAKWSIYKTSKGESEAERVRKREESKKHSWLLVQHWVGQVNTFPVSISAVSSNTSPTNWPTKCLSSLRLSLLLSSLLLEFVLAFRLYYLTLSYFISHTFSLEFISLHLCLSSSSKHQSNAQWLIWFSSQTYISRSIMLPLAVSVGWVPVCQLRTVARQPSR